MDVQVVGDGLSITIGKPQSTRTVRGILTNDLHLPAHFIHELAAQKAIRTQNQPALLDGPLKLGARLRIEGGVEEPYGVVPEVDGLALELGVLYEDNHLLVINKPPGVIIYPGDEEHEDTTLAHIVAGYYALHGILRKVMHVHRLDKDTTGAILYAKHTYSLRAMDAQLAKHEINRTYLALVRGRLPSAHGIIDAPIGRDRHVSGRYRVSRTGKSAVTHYRVLATANVANDAVSLVECQLETGRTHQIRVHLSDAGCPIIGDTLYGVPRGIGQVVWDDGIALHARKLAFYHPYEEQEIVVAAPLPERFRIAMNALGWDEQMLFEH